jgi:predicted DNA-binding mobile mystery protein A
MKAKHKKLAREQLEATLKRLEPLKTLVPPGKGWIRAIRDALGMTGEQLAVRLHVNKQRVSRIQQDEKLGKVKLETLKNVAGALDCIFVYGFVPRDSLEQTVRNQARLAAQKRMVRSNQTMRLEKQELSEAEKEKALKYLIEDIMNEMPKSLWSEK